MLKWNAEAVRPSFTQSRCSQSEDLCRGRESWREDESDGAQESYKPWLYYVLRVSWDKCFCKNQGQKKRINCKSVEADKTTTI